MQRFWVSNRSGKMNTIFSHWHWLFTLNAPRCCIATINSLRPTNTYQITAPALVEVMAPCLIGVRPSPELVTNLWLLLILWSIELLEKKSSWIESEITKYPYKKMYWNTVSVKQKLLSLGLNVLSTVNEIIINDRSCHISGQKKWINKRCDRHNVFHMVAANSGPGIALGSGLVTAWHHDASSGNDSQLSPQQMCVSLVNRSVGHTTEMSGSHILGKYVRFHSNLSHWPQSALCQAYLLWSSNVVVT